MNEALKKRRPRTESERILQHREHEKEYMKRHKTVCVTLSKERDGDILDWLEESDNKSETIRAALRDARNAEKNNRGFYNFVTHTGKKKQEEEC